MQYRNGYQRYFSAYLLAIFDTNSFVLGVLVNSVNNNAAVPERVKTGL